MSQCQHTLIVMYACSIRNGSVTLPAILIFNFQILNIDMTGRVTDHCDG